MIIRHLNWAFAALALCVATPTELSAQTLATLVNFNLNTGNAAPTGTLVQGTDGNLYGTTSGNGPFGYGTIFRISPSGTLTTLYHFCAKGPPCTDGYHPLAGLIQAANGAFYGTTEYGGTTNYGGTIFKFSSSGLTTLYSFCSQPNCTDGEQPYAPLVQAANGEFYGTTGYGGAYGGGTIFKFSRSGSLTTLHHFCAQPNCADGQYPFAPLVPALDGSLYGTTVFGGTSDWGVVFKFNSGGLTKLYEFNGNDGKDPGAGLTFAADGKFYGATAGAAGAAGSDLYGTIFSITPNGVLATLHNFSYGDGAGPGLLVQGTDGNLYGTTQYGTTGASNNGTVFSITPGGTLALLHLFTGSDGFRPIAGLVQHTNGNFYGTTISGGYFGSGTLFSLSMGLSPFLRLRPEAGQVGSLVQILGTDLTGATSITFKGTPAAFTVVSSSLITATVPTGATSGNVQVVMPSGTLSSNVNFHVF